MNVDSSKDQCVLFLNLSSLFFQLNKTLWRKAFCRRHEAPGLPYIWRVRLTDEWRMESALPSDNDSDLAALRLKSRATGCSVKRSRAVGQALNSPPQGAAFNYLRSQSTLQLKQKQLPHLKKQKHEQLLWLTGPGRPTLNASWRSNLYAKRERLAVCGSSEISVWWSKRSCNITLCRYETNKSESTNKQVPHLSGSHWLIHTINNKQKQLLASSVKSNVSKTSDSCPGVHIPY